VQGVKDQQQHPLTITAKGLFDEGPYPKWDSGNFPWAIQVQPRLLVTLCQYSLVLSSSACLKAVEPLQSQWRPKGVSLAKKVA